MNYKPEKVKNVVNSLAKKYKQCILIHVLYKKESYFTEVEKFADRYSKVFHKLS